MSFQNSEGNEKFACKQQSGQVYSVTRSTNVRWRIHAQCNASISAAGACVPFADRSVDRSLYIDFSCHSTILHSLPIHIFWSTDRIYDAFRKLAGSVYLTGISGSGGLWEAGLAQCAGSPLEPKFAKLDNKPPPPLLPPSSPVTPLDRETFGTLERMILASPPYSHWWTYIYCWTVQEL